MSTGCSVKSTSDRQFTVPHIPSAATPTANTLQTNKPLSCTARCVASCKTAGDVKTGKSTGPFANQKLKPCVGNRSAKSKDGKLLSVLVSVREPLADYQQKGGLGRYEQVGFVCLLTSIYQQAYQACLSFLSMLCNLLPFVDVFLLIVRFTLDKMISICKTDATSKAVLGSVVLVWELLIIFAFFSLISIFLLFPIFSIILALICRILGLG